MATVGHRLREALAGADLLISEDANDRVILESASKRRYVLSPTQAEELLHAVKGTSPGRKQLDHDASPSEAWNAQRVFTIIDTERWIGE